MSVRFILCVCVRACQAAASLNKQFVALQSETGNTMEDLK